MHHEIHIQTLDRHSNATLSAIRRISRLAFASTNMPPSFDKFRNSDPDCISIVAICDKEIIGHLLISKVHIGEPKNTVAGMGIAELAVLPDHQRRGVGSKLIEFSIDLLRRLNCPFVILVGTPDFYPRFGFVPGSTYSIRCQWEKVPDEAFMILILDDVKFGGITGVARFSGLC